MSTSQKIERMQVIMQSEEFMPGVREATKIEALALVDELKDRSKEVSLRTLIKTVKIANGGAKNWKKLAEYMLIQG
jgi:CO dehydrogenase/acetyl-CoA synthase alpha subunit